MADTTLKYGTRLIAVFAAAAGLLGSAIYYNPARRQIQPQDMAELMEGRSERQNVSGFSLSSGRVVRQVHSSDLDAICADIAAACPEFVQERAGTDLAHNWDNDGWCLTHTNHYVMWSWAKLTTYVNGAYFPDRTNLTYWGRQVQVEDLEVVWHLVNELRSTVVESCSFASGVHTTWSTGPIEDRPMNGAYAACDFDVNPSEEPWTCGEGADMYAWANGHISYPPGVPSTGPEWWSETRTWGRSITADGSGTPSSTEDVTGHAPEACWRITYDFSWERWCHAYPNHDIFFYDDEHGEGFGEYEEWASRLSVAIPSRTVAIGGMAVFRWDGSVFDSESFGSTATSATTSELAEPEDNGHTQSFSYTMDAEFSEECNESIDRLSFAGRDSTGSSDYDHQECSTSDNRNPVKLTWSFERCVDP